MLLIERIGCIRDPSDGICAAVIVNPAPNAVSVHPPERVIAVLIHDGDPRQISQHPLFAEI